MLEKAWWYFEDVVANKDSTLSQRKVRDDEYVNDEFIQQFNTDANITPLDIKYDNESHKFSHSITMLNLANILK